MLCSSLLEIAHRSGVGHCSPAPQEAEAEPCPEYRNSGLYTMCHAIRVSASQVLIQLAPRRGCQRRGEPVQGGNRAGRDSRLDPQN